MSELFYQFTPAGDVYINAHQVTRVSATDEGGTKVNRIHLSDGTHLDIPDDQIPMRTLVERLQKAIG